MKTFLLIGGLAMASMSHAVLFDDFTSGAYDSGPLTAIGTVDAWQTPSSALGSTRYVSSTITANPSNQNYRVVVDPTQGMTFVNSGVRVDGGLKLGYGYADGSTVAGSNALNLNSTGSSLYQVTFTSNDLANAATVTLFSSTFGSVSRSANVPGMLGANQTFDFDFSGEAALADVDAVTVSFAPLPSGDFSVSRVEAVPEPASMAAIGIGIVGLLRARKRRA